MHVILLCRCVIIRKHEAKRRSCILEQGMDCSRSLALGARIRVRTGKQSLPVAPREFGIGAGYTMACNWVRASEMAMGIF